jgi:uncharacterized membrane protein YqgA involved in biofilm formation
MNGDKIKKFIEDNIYTAVVFIVCVSYIALGVLDIVKKDKSIVEILADGSMSMIMGLMIGRLLSMQGVMKGEHTDKYTNAIEEHEKLCRSINNQIEKLDFFCREKTKQAEDFIKTNILGAVGIKYEDYVHGKYYGVRKADIGKDKYKAIKKADKLKITPLTTDGIMGNISPIKDPYNLGTTKKKMLSKENKKAFFSKIGFAIIFGVFGVRLIKDISWATIIWAVVQVVVFVASGVGRYTKSYFFIVDDMVAKLKKQDNYIYMFKEYLGEENVQQIQGSEQEIRQDQVPKSMGEV